MESKVRSVTPRVWPCYGKLRQTIGVCGGSGHALDGVFFYGNDALWRLRWTSKLLQSVFWALNRRPRV